MPRRTVCSSSKKSLGPRGPREIAGGRGSAPALPVCQCCALQRCQQWRGRHQAPCWLRPQLPRGALPARPDSSDTSVHDTFGMPWTIVVHGGAGSAQDEVESPERMAVLRAAVAAARQCLCEGGSALDAVQLAVERMEDSPLFNAGRGSAFHALGGHEMDAAIMSGDRRCGAVAGLRTTKQPIRVARYVLDESPHVFFSADGAERVARESGAEQASEAYFATGLRRAQLQRELAEQQRERQADREGGREGGRELQRPPRPARSNGTVGAVALDVAGHLAAATSTGGAPYTHVSPLSVICTYKSNKSLYTLGMTAKPPGRIGDSPVIGAGTFASDGTCAVSGTGNGELFLAHSVAATISAFVSEFTLLPMSGARRALSLSYPCHE